LIAAIPHFKIQEILCTPSSPLKLTNKEIHDLVDGHERYFRQWKPKGISTSEEILDNDFFQDPTIGTATGYKCVDQYCGGFRQGELVVVTAGTGIGKSTFVQEVAYHMGFVGGIKCGMIFLEEREKRTLLRLAAIHYNIAVKDLSENPNLLTTEQWEEFRALPELKNFVFNSHFGSLDSRELFSKIDYMIDHCGCQFIFLDHISIVVSGMTSSKEGERKDIDILMTQLVTRGVDKNVGIVVISHLNVPERNPHEEGGRVTLSHLRGSGSIKQLAFTVLAQERNQQDADSTRALLRSLKCRETGFTGPLGVLEYDIKTGRLLETKAVNVADFDRQLRGKKSSNGGSSQQNSNYEQFRNTKFVDQY
jgi:twinkle protein